MAKQSAGLLIYRRRRGDVEILLVHPGGPFWRNKDLRAWSIPKGEFANGEDPLEAAKREFREETGFNADGNFLLLQPLKQPGGKTVHAWALERDYDPEQVQSNTFQLEWPPKSGKTIEVPEIDRAAWFVMEVAKAKILPGQCRFLVELESCLSNSEVSK